MSGALDVSELSEQGRKSRPQGLPQPARALEMIALTWRIL
jgi:hypothetical protein